MTSFDAILLGIIQGLTEFLPVSSSGHLVLAQELLGVNEPGLGFELLTHAGTLGAVLVYFRESIGRLISSLTRRQPSEERRLVLWVLVGTVPAGLAGLFLEDFFERAFSNPLVTSTMLLVTGLILLATRFITTGEGKVGWRSALAMGIGQALAIMPGISRSGTTIAAGLFARVEPSRAAEFSFLLAIPAIAGAVVLKADELLQLPSNLLWSCLVGGLLAFISGLAAVYVVMTAIRLGKFVFFAYYCFAAGLLGLYLFI